MFKVLRILAVVGTLTYLSPVRGDGDLPLSEALAWGGEALVRTATSRAPEALAAWQALPDSARRALADRLAGPAAETAALPAAADTLRADDLRPPWRGSRAGKP